MQKDSLGWYNNNMENNHGENMKIWTRAEIESVISSSDTAVEKAMIRLFNLEAFHERDAEAGTHFAQWLSGMNGKSEIKYPKKSLGHHRAVRRFRKMCLRGEEPIDRARRIALLHSQILTDYANRPVEDLTQIPLPFGEDSELGEDIYEDLDQIIDDYNSSDPEVDDEFDDIDVSGPPPGTWAATARMMARGDDSGFDWDMWKEEMKMRDME